MFNKVPVVQRHRSDVFYFIWTPFTLFGPFSIACIADPEQTTLSKTEGKQIHIS